MGPSKFNEPSTRRLALDSTSSYWFSPNYTHLTCRNFICQHLAITKTTVKQHPLAIIWFDSHWESPRFFGTHAIFSAINSHDASLHGIPNYTPPLQRSWKGVYWFHLVRLSICGQNRVRSVSSTILVRSILYLHILSSNFRRCAACKVCVKIQKFEILVNSLNL